MNDEQSIPEKIIPESPNFQTELAAQIADIAPQIISDGKLDVNKLRELVNGDAETAPEKFGLFWPGKQRAQAVAQLPTTATLKPAPEESVDWDTTKNIFIEGDNLEVLKALQDSYRRKIKMIYIDPPYNTGKEFIYPDNFQEGLKTYLEYTGQKNEAGENTESKKETSGRKHSSWLSMMYPRLQVAKSLLSEDGLIFISIDDHEQDALKRICTEVFGESNFVTQLIWTNKEGGGSSDSKTFRRKHEYIFAIARNIDEANINGLPVSNEERYTQFDEYEQTRGKFYPQKLGMGTIQYSASLDYPIDTPDGNQVSPADNNGGKKACWRWSRDKLKWGLENGYIVFRKDSQGVWIVYTKQYLNADNEGNIIDRTQRPSSVIDEYSTTQASKGIRKLFDGIDYFDYTKPVALIKQLLTVGSDKDSIVLDFFSGSGTTAHALMQLNVEDGGNRRHIQVQLPELTDESSEAYKAGYKTISDIAKERIRRAGMKIKEESGSIDTGFRVYKLGSSNFAEWDEAEAAEDPTQAVLNFASNKNSAATPEELLAEIMLKSRITLDAKVDKKNLSSGGWVYIVDDGRLIAYVDDNQLTLEQATEIADMSPAKFVALDSAFNNNDALKINIANICRNKHVGEFKTI
jgi:adenine-specific DNA-methyltransferase